MRTPLALATLLVVLVVAAPAQARYLHMADARWAASAVLRSERGMLDSCQRSTARYIHCAGLVPSPFDENDPLLGGTWQSIVRVHAEPGRRGEVWLWDVYHDHLTVRR